jgi:hypothetical protein
LQITFPDLQFSVHGVYCHQKPLADFSASKPSTNAVEIGDLLVVYRFIDENDKEILNSLLLQAKISSTEILNTTGADG